MPEADRCPNCGASTAPTDAFCSECGHRLARSVEQSPTSGPPPYSPPPPPGSQTKRDDDFLEDLFDFGFTKFVTPIVVKFVYKVAMLVIALVWLAYVILGFFISPWAGVLVVVFGPLVALLWLLVCRITLELAMVIFRIGDDLHDVRERKDLEGAGPGSAHSSGNA